MTNLDRFRSSRTANRWQDWLNLILAIWLFLSPWILQFALRVSPDMPGSLWRASWNAWILGVVIGLVAIAALTRVQLWEEWLNLLLAIWVFVAPWVLGFSTAMAPAWDHWIVGILVFIFAVWDLQTLYRTPSAGAPAT